MQYTDIEISKTIYRKSMMVRRYCRLLLLTKMENSFIIDISVVRISDEWSL